MKPLLAITFLSCLLALTAATKPASSPSAPIGKPGFNPIYDSKMKGYIPYDVPSKVGYPAHFDHPTRQTPLTPVIDPALAAQGGFPGFPGLPGLPGLGGIGGPGGPFNLVGIISMALPFILILGLGALLLPLIFGLLGMGPSPFPFLPWSKRRSITGFPSISKEQVMELLTTVGEAIESVDAKMKKKTE